MVLILKYVISVFYIIIRQRLVLFSFIGSLLTLWQPTKEIKYPSAIRPQITSLWQDATYQETCTLLTYFPVYPCFQSIKWASKPSYKTLELSLSLSNSLIILLDSNRIVWFDVVSLSVLYIIQGVTWVSADIFRGERTFD